MNNCIFSASCIESICDKSCPILSQSSYLLDRNNITLDNSVYHMEDAVSCNIQQFIETKQDDRLIAIKVAKTNVKAAQITYGYILKHWKGSQLHCSVYMLKFQRYMDLVQRSWALKSEPSELQYMKIFMDSCKVLVVSGLDFIMFKDFQSQLLLTLIQDRDEIGKQTVLVLPKSELQGEGTFFSILKGQIEKVVKS